MSIEDWLRTERKQAQGASIVCKVLVTAFPIVGNWIVWQIGNGSKLRISEDPWMGVNANFRLSNALLEVLHNQGIFHLKDAVFQMDRNQWIQGWETAERSNLQRELAEEWNQYIKLLSHSAIKRNEDEDQLKWSKNIRTGEYTVKLGYSARIEEDLGNERTC